MQPLSRFLAMLSFTSVFGRGLVGSGMLLLIALLSAVVSSSVASPSPRDLALSTPSLRIACGLHSATASRAAFQFPSLVPKLGLSSKPSVCLPLITPAAPRPRSSLQTLVAQYRGRGGRGGRRGRGPPRIARVEGPPRNDAIVYPVMRVVVANPDGKDDMLGVMSKEEALAAAEDRGQDLVVVSPDANPPVCKIINYDKLRYENEKKEKLKKKNTKNAELKEVKLSYKIDVHDYEVRKRATQKFLVKGDKVKVSIRFKGREMAHQELAFKTLQQLQADMEQFATSEKRPTMEGRQMQVVADDVAKRYQTRGKERNDTWHRKTEGWGGGGPVLTAGGGEQMILAPTVEVLKQAELARKEKQGQGKGKKGKGKMMDDDEESSDDLEVSDEEEATDDTEEEEEEAEGAVRADYELDDLTVGQVAEKIASVGERIRDLKSAEAPKDKIAPHVDELLSLKARYQELSGEAWAPAPASK